MLWTDEAGHYRLIEKGHQRREVSGRIEESAWFPMNPELAPRPHFEDLLQSPQASRQGHKRIGERSHQCFSFVHALDDVQFREPPMPHLALPETARNDADGTPARFQDRIGDHSHQTDAPSSVHQRHVRLCEQPPEIVGYGCERIVGTQVGTAENAKALDHRPRIMGLSQRRHPPAVSHGFQPARIGNSVVIPAGRMPAARPAGSRRYEKQRHPKCT